MYSFVACFSHFTIDHASLSIGTTVPTPNKETSNVWALIDVFPHITLQVETMGLSYPLAGALGGGGCSR